MTTGPLLDELLEIRLPEMYSELERNSKLPVLMSYRSQVSYETMLTAFYGSKQNKKNYPALQTFISPNELELLQYVI
jgi:hypothetical protein